MNQVLTEVEYVNAPVLALRPREAAKALGLGERKLWELTNRGIIPHIKLDKCVLYPVDALRAWLVHHASGGERQ
ncbi:Helix-turn-helix domain protein [Phycisphaerae bacterium RAS2]|nr:Helix-turn-helix domain protein [Phycisphaerae bacterium RAS2]